MTAVRAVELPDGTEVALPLKWTICSTCQGEGKSCAHLGAFTREEMDQQGEDFEDDYRAGFYDKPCERCDGTGKVQEVDARSLERMPQDVRDAYAEACDAEAESRAAWDSEAPLRRAEGWQ